MLYESILALHLSSWYKAVWSKLFQDMYPNVPIKSTQATSTLANAAAHAAHPHYPFLQSSHNHHPQSSHRSHYRYTYTSHSPIASSCTRRRPRLTRDTLRTTRYRTNHPSRSTRHSTRNTSSTTSDSTNHPTRPTRHHRRNTPASTRYHRRKTRSHRCRIRCNCAEDAVGTRGDDSNDGANGGGGVCGDGCRDGSNGGGCDADAGGYVRDDAANLGGREGEEEGGEGQVAVLHVGGVCWRGEVRWSLSRELVMGREEDVYWGGCFEVSVLGRRSDSLQ